MSILPFLVLLMKR